MNKATLIGFLALLLFLILIISGCSNNPGKYDEFAQCLTDEGFVMAGTDWCSHCKDQKKIFGKSFDFIDYKNCDIQRDWCDSNGVHSYPTWVLPNGTKETGVQKIYILSQLSGCSLK